MNSKTRQRAMRSFLASILQSDLTTNEIHELADELMFGSFGKDLSDLLREAIHISDVGRQKEIGHFGNERERERPNSAREIAMDAITRRRLAKRMILEIMSLASPWVKPKDLENSGSVRDIVDKYLLTASSAEVAKFLSILVGEPTDAYVKGISRRDRPK